MCSRSGGCSRGWFQHLAHGGQSAVCRGTGCVATPDDARLVRRKDVAGGHLQDTLSRRLSRHGRNRGGQAGANWWCKLVVPRKKKTWLASSIRRPSILRQHSRPSSMAKEASRRTRWRRSKRGSPRHDRDSTTILYGIRAASMPSLERAPHQHLFLFLLHNRHSCSCPSCPCRCPSCPYGSSSCRCLSVSGAGGSSTAARHHWIHV